MNNKNDFKLKLLKSLNDVSNPYIDIRDLEAEYDISSPDFTFTFKNLCREGLIASESNTLGLTIGCDGDVQWSIVKLYVTDLGRLAINPTKTSKGTLLLKISENPLASTVIGGVLLTTALYYYLPILKSKPTQPQSSNQKELKQVHNLNKNPNQPPSLLNTKTAEKKDKIP